MKITFLWDPPSQAVPFASGPERYDSFIRELSKSTTYTVDRVTGGLDKAPQDGYILYAGSKDISLALQDCDMRSWSEVTARLILLDASPSNVRDELEKFRPVAAVDSLRFAEWETDPACSGHFGRKDLVEMVDVEPVTLPQFCTEHYCLFTSDHHGLPQLLANYLNAYDSTRTSDPLENWVKTSLPRWVELVEKELVSLSGPTAEKTLIYEAVRTGRSLLNQLNLPEKVRTIDYYKQLGQLAFFMATHSSTLPKG